LAVAETLQCHRCGITCTVDTSVEPIVIDYHYDDWRKRCHHSDTDDLATCAEMLPSIRRLIASR
jgi:hypothetical protein